MRSIAAAVALVVVAGLDAANTRRNVIIFVADGLRHGSVNQRDTPALWKIRTEGVHFENSHSLPPTVTMANASAIATGHQLGDTGTFGNVVWLGFQTFASGNFGLTAGTPVTFLESDQILADLDAHFGGSYLGEETLLEAAARQGYNTAAIGKMGPIAAHAPAAMAAASGGFSPPNATIVVDDSTGTALSPALQPALRELLMKARIYPEAPTRSNGYGPTSPYNNGNQGTHTRPGTLAANVLQQQWLADVTTRGILPLFERDRDKPFALVFWSRDPDGTQHNQGDSLGALAPGINGATSRSGARNADRTLAQLLAWLDGHPTVKANTDVIVTSDHGFATISRREIGPAGQTTSSAAATHTYADAAGVVDTAKGTLPSGCLAIDLSLDLHLGLFDPDRPTGIVGAPYHRVRLEADPWEHPAAGSSLLGAGVRKPDGSDATAIVAANDGSDLIFVPDGNADTVKRIAEVVLRYDYVGGVFVDDQYGEVPGALPLSALGLVGSAKLPRPALVVAFKVFYLNPKDVQTAVQIVDTRSGLQQGQGSHGGMGRDSTYNNMAAIGPDFKHGFVDRAPVGNADIAPTLARVMGIALASKGTLRGRILQEALSGGSEASRAKAGRLLSTSANGRQTLLEYQDLGPTRYIDAACLISQDSRAGTCR